MAGERILLVDDDPDLLAIHTRFLKGQGYQVIAAANGAQALRAMEGEEFPVALLDLMLPDISGLELLARLKSRFPDTEVILFTGYGGLDTAIQALRGGAYDYLVKTDLRLPDLQAVLDRALERRRLTRANRELLDNLRQAREELARRRALELSLIRRIGETLSRPRTVAEWGEGLLSLIREGLPCRALGLILRNAGGETAWEGKRRQDDLADGDLQAFSSWLRDRRPAAGAGGAPVRPPVPDSLQAVLWEKIDVEPLIGVVGVGREEPFTPEEAELFRIFALQGEAALTNLLLFDEVKSLSLRDGLTGLHNVRYFWEMLNHHVELSRRYGWPLSLLFLDLDDFKQVNDHLGHLQGDMVLRTVAAYLQQSVRQADLTCRYGGEEFVVLLPQTPANQALTLAERLRAGVAATPIPQGDGKMFITVSIGVGTLAAGMDGAALVDQADRALYLAKEAGKNRVAGPDT
ncbi:MAG: diguanylate cyclase [Deltaproteobacteria bacterium]|nr:diguanylate cyclase [Deltaproteobacteria bacterium]